MITETIDYECGGVNFKGYLVYDGEFTSKRPGVVVAPAVYGVNDFARQKAYELAKLGYVGFAADVYGESPKTKEEAYKLMIPLFINRSLLRDRICAAFEVLKNHHIVESDEIGAIGFCFGGLTVIELLRSGVDVSGVVSFHGLLGDQFQGNKAQMAPNADKILGSLLILLGNDDPFVSDEDIKKAKEEFTRANVDWQMHIYGHTVHSFTNPEAQDLKSGLQFDPKANMRFGNSVQIF